MILQKSLYNIGYIIMRILHFGLHVGFTEVSVHVISDFFQRKQRA